MMIHLGKKIVCVKDISSNMIEEAIFILKSNVTDNTNIKFEEKTKEILLDEAEKIVDEYDLQIQGNKVSKGNLNIDKISQLKKEAIYLTGLFIVACIFIAIVI